MERASKRCYIGTFRRLPPLTALAQHERMLDPQGLLFLGRTNWRDRIRPFGMHSADRMAHLYIVGQAGTGKTTLLQNPIWKDLKRGHGLAFLDPHGDAVQDLVARFPVERRSDLVYVDVNDPNLAIGFNPLEAVRVDPPAKPALSGFRRDSNKATRPCPCGWLGSGARECRCPRALAARYGGRVSGPLLDRFDLRVTVKPVDASALLSAPSPTGATEQVRFEDARRVQAERAAFLPPPSPPGAVGRWLPPPDSLGPMKIPAAVRERFRRHGRSGGLARARRLPAAVRSGIARRAALSRWTRERFGRSRLADLDMPGGALVDRGLDDLAAGRETPESLLLCLAAPRLRREGVPLPPVTVRDADFRLYRRLEVEHGGLAHARYLALLREIASFADACRTVTSRRGRHAR